MSLRKILIAAAVAAPLAFSPVQASAQQGRGEEAREQAQQFGGQTVSQLPPGIAQRVESGGDVPEGIDRRYSPAPAPVSDVPPEPEPEPQPEEPCSEWIVFDSFGIPIGVEDCNGNFFPF